MRLSKKPEEFKPAAVDHTQAGDAGKSGAEASKAGYTPFSASASPPQQEKLKKEAEAIIERILRGEAQPVEGMRIRIIIRGPFTIFGAESSPESVFEYSFPAGEKQPSQTKEAPPQPPEQEVQQVEKIFATR